MNTPGMTEKMRKELEGAATPPTRERLIRDGLSLFGFIAFVLAGAAIMTSGFGNKIYEAVQLGGDPWLAGWLTGAMTALLLVALVSTTFQGARRWEITRPAEKRRLALPMWMRWSLFLSDISIVAAWSAVVVTFLLLQGNPYYLLRTALMGLCVGLNILKAMLIGLANRKGWTWQPAPAA